MNFPHVIVNPVCPFAHVRAVWTSVPEKQYVLSVNFLKSQLNRIFPKKKNLPRNGILALVSVVPVHGVTLRECLEALWTAVLAILLQIRALSSTLTTPLHSACN